MFGILKRTVYQTVRAVVVFVCYITSVKLTTHLHLVVLI